MCLSVPLARVQSFWIASPQRHCLSDIRMASWKFLQVLWRPLAILQQCFHVSWCAGGIHELFPAQAAVWRELTGGHSTEHDVCIAAPTGSGKTLAYALPIINALTGYAPCSQAAQKPICHKCLQYFSIQSAVTLVVLQVGIVP